MKNQYFGDKRDYFKYALLELLMLRHPVFRRLTCVWMLTPDSRNNDGNKPFGVLPGREHLASFLIDCRLRGVRNVQELRRYFASTGIDYFAYGDDSSQPFGRLTRTSYFRSLPADALRDALVFFDPDNGLAPPGGATAAHIREEELVATFQRMTGNGAAVLYQHLPRVRAATFWPSVVQRLSRLLNTDVAAIAEADVAFLVAPKSPSDLSLIVGTFRVHQKVAASAGHKVAVFV